MEAAQAGRPPDDMTRPPAPGGSAQPAPAAGSHPPSKPKDPRAALQAQAQLQPNGGMPPTAALATTWAPARTQAGQQPTQLSTQSSLTAFGVPAPSSFAGPGPARAAPPAGPAPLVHPALGLLRAAATQPPRVAAALPLPLPLPAQPVPDPAAAAAFQGAIARLHGTVCQLASKAQGASAALGWPVAGGITSTDLSALHGSMEAVLRGNPKYVSTLRTCASLPASLPAEHAPLAPPPPTSHAVLRYTASLPPPGSAAPRRAAAAAVPPLAVLGAQLSSSHAQQDRGAAGAGGSASGDGGDPGRARVRALALELSATLDAACAERAAGGGGGVSPGLAARWEASLAELLAAADGGGGGAAGLAGAALRALLPRCRESPELEGIAVRLLLALRGAAQRGGPGAAGQCAAPRAERAAGDDATLAVEALLSIGGGSAASTSRERSAGCDRVLGVAVPRRKRSMGALPHGGSASGGWLEASGARALLRHRSGP